MRPQFLAFALLGFLGLSGVSRAEEPLPAKVLTDLKTATVFIQLTGARFAASGSGFVIRSDDDAAYVATNHHVVATHRVYEQEYTRVFRGRKITGKRTVTLDISNARLQVIFQSGGKDEQTMSAEVVASDEDRDLALLKVSKVKGIKPIDFRNLPELRETLTVYVLGFPYGAALATDKRNPEITIGKGTISSIRKHKSGELSAIQIDGALNPGNSGGPIVDGNGRLVGISVATIRGSGLGFAIPPTDLITLVEGRPGKPRFIPTADRTIRVEVPLEDPFHALKSVGFAYVAVDSVGKDADKEIRALPKATQLELKIEKNKAVGVMKLDQSGQELRCQLHFVNGAGKTLLSALVPFKPEKGIDITKDKVFLADLKEIEPKVGWGRFGKKDATVSAGGKKYTEALSMHAVSNGDASVKYRLGQKAKTFIASVAINDSAETRTATPLVFRVVADGKVLWESKPIPKAGTTQDCRVNVTGVDMLELQVSCAGSNSYGQSVWLDPHLEPDRGERNEGPKKEAK